jgi:hypothetical protein
MDSPPFLPLYRRSGEKAMGNGKRCLLDIIEQMFYNKKNEEEISCITSRPKAFSLSATA